MKRLYFLFAAAIFGLVSCNMGEDGESYLSINYYEDEAQPASLEVSYYVEYDDDRLVQHYLPYKVWGKYYPVEPGTYYVDWQYIYEGDLRAYPYSCEIEIWRNYGRTKNRDGKDVYFDLMLREDGIIRKRDFTHEEVRNKSCIASEVQEKTFLYTTEKEQGDYNIRYTVYKLPCKNIEE